MATTRNVMTLFAFTSLLMWIFPIGLLQVFNRNMVPGLEKMSKQTKTFLSGGLAVLSVNVVIGFYIYLALREPPAAGLPQPDKAFKRRAEASLKEIGGGRNSPAEEAIRRPEEAGEKSGKSE